jgi:hypothetical protein
MNLFSLRLRASAVQSLELKRLDDNQDDDGE